MKIAIIAHNLYPIAEPYAGGLEKITHLLVDEFVEKGHETYLFAKEGSDTKAELIVFPTRKEFEESFHEEEHKWLGWNRDEMFYMYIYNWTMNKIHTMNCDIIHNHSLHHIPIVRGVEFGKQFITTFHTPIFTQIAFGLKCNSQIPSTTNYTSVSQFQQSIYKEFVNSKVIYNGIEVNKWEYEIDNKEDYLFWMGRICKEKAPHQAAQACLEAKQKLIIAGPNSEPEYFDKELMPLLENDLIKYIGHLKQNKINEYLKKAKGYLFTSIWEEPYGLTIAEALASATPVIAYNVGAAPEILTKQTSFVIPKEDIIALKTAIENIYKIKPADCRKRAEEFCNIKNIAQDYLNFYKTLL